MSARTCQRCGAPLPGEARFCPSCGAPVEDLPGEERRVVTVLFADLAGSTELAAGLDPERYREVMNAFYRSAGAELASLRGRAEKFVGDAVMALFGLPHAHDDDALRAVRAGLAIRDRTARLGQELGLPVPLRVRVGINTGPVAAGPGGENQPVVSGAAVNLAARLEQAAEPGEVLAGETTRQLTRHAVEFGQDREVAAKGFEDRVTAWPVAALSSRSTRQTIPLVGRARDLGLLLEAMERSRETSRAHMVTVLGEPGIGKSRLAEELLARLPEGTPVLFGRASEFEEDVTFAPVAEMVRGVLGVERDDDPGKVRERLREVVAGCCDPSEAERVAARLGLALGLEREKPGRPSRVGEVRSGFLTFVEGLARDRAVVLVFEDLHLARPELLDLIEAVMRRARRVPVFVLCLARDHLLEARPGWGGGLPDSVTIRLEPLTLEESVELALAAGGPIDPATAERVAAQAGGNPFFIIETTGMLLHEREQHAAITQLPPTVQAVVASRLDHLPDDARELVRRASIFYASTFHESELSFVAEPAPETLALLEDEEVLVREPQRPGVWRFRHDMLRKAAYQSLPKRQAIRLHLAVVEGFERAGEAGRFPQAMAYHLGQAARASLDLDPSDRALADRATVALAGAGDQALRRSLLGAGLELYERALALAGPAESWGRREARILAAMGEARYWLGNFDRAEGDLGRALRLAGDDPWTRTLAYRFLADVALNVRGDPDRASLLFDEGLRAARELNDDWATARTLLMAGWVPIWAGDRDRARAMFEEALALARANPEGDPWAEARALTSLSSAISSVGDETQCLALGEEALAIGRQADDPFTVAVAHQYVGNSLRRMGRLDQALPHLDASVEGFRELGVRWELASAVGDRGFARRLVGRLDEAEADLREALALCRALQERALATWTSSELARVLLARGEVREAREVLDDPLARLSSDAATDLSLHGAEAWLALAEGDRDAAETRAKEIVAIAGGSHRNPRAAWLWWVGVVFGPEHAGGEALLQECRRTLEATNWHGLIREPELVRY